jgi:hypothetical protein
VQRRAVIGALLLVGLGVVLGATVFRTDIARAAGLAQPPQAVREQNLDGNGNIKVHEQGSVPVRPLAPVSPWSNYAGLVIGHGGAVLAGPSDVIDLTSLSASVQPGAQAYISLIVQYVADTATDCSSASGGAIVYAVNNVTGPFSASFPTPLDMTAPAGQKACLFGAAGGTGSTTTGGADLNTSGFYG